MTQDTNSRVDPVRPVAPWLGGKKNLALRLIRRIEAIPHALYAEPFVGMGGVFLRRKLRPRAEVINDASRDIATLFRILQRHYPQFLEVLRFQLTTLIRPRSPTSNGLRGFSTCSGRPSAERCQARTSG
jgi:DNA adenine methylase